MINEDKIEEVLSLCVNIGTNRLPDSKKNNGLDLNIYDSMQEANALRTVDDLFAVETRLIEMNTGIINTISIPVFFFPKMDSITSTRGILVSLLLCTLCNSGN